MVPGGPARRNDGAGRTITSLLVVSVLRKPAHERKFRYDHVEAAQAYMKELADQKLEPRLHQERDAREVRIRQKGYPSLNVTHESRKAAEAFVKSGGS